MSKTLSFCAPQVIALVAVFALSPAWAAKAAAPAPSTSPTAEAVYQKERAACLRGTSPQGRATCLTEAGAALAEARRSRLGNGEDANDRSRNAEQRCKNVAAADREACLRMTHGEGTASGSVDGGGVIKELVTITAEPLVVIPAAPAASR